MRRREQKVFATAPAASFCRNAIRPTFMNNIKLSLECEDSLEYLKIRMVLDGKIYWDDKQDGPAIPWWGSFLERSYLSFNLSGLTRTFLLA